MSDQQGPAGQGGALAAEDPPTTSQGPPQPGVQSDTAAGQSQPGTPAADQPGTVAQPGAAPAQPQPGAAPAQAQPRTTAPAQPAGATMPPRRHVLRRTRTGGVWVALGASAVVLLLLLIFILENQRHVNIGFFGAHASLPVGVAMLLAAVGGAVVVIIPGTGRIMQLRLTARRHRRKDTAAATAAGAQQPVPQRQPVEPVPPQPPANPAPH